MLTCTGTGTHTYRMHLHRRRHQIASPQLTACMQIAWPRRTQSVHGKIQVGRYPGQHSTFQIAAGQLPVSICGVTVTLAAAARTLHVVDVVVWSLEPTPPRLECKRPLWRGLTLLFLRDGAFRVRNAVVRSMLVDLAQKAPWVHGRSKVRTAPRSCGTVVREAVVQIMARCVATRRSAVA